jgi:hypothetical protein
MPSNARAARTCEAVIINPSFALVSSFQQFTSLDQIAVWMLQASVWIQAF